MSRQEINTMTCEIINHIGTVENESQTWKIELNLVSWGGKEPKYDIRKWSPDHTKMGKGIVLTEEEIRSLYLIMRKEFKDADVQSANNS